MSKWLTREEGQGMVEYGLIVALVAIVVIDVLTALGPAIGDILSIVVRMTMYGALSQGRALLRLDASDNKMTPREGEDVLGGWV